MTTAVLAEPENGFRTLALSPSVQAALQRARYFQPTPIQAALIPEALTGKDVIGQAQTGTGKTAAFLLPFLNSWTDTGEPGPTALVMAPTRELVAQVNEEAIKLAPDPNCRAVAIYGGQRFGGQLSALRRGCAIVVGSPGRVLDHLGRGTMSLAGVRYVVLDEADRMLDIGFRPDIEKILRQCPKQRQTLLLSATISPPILRLAQRYMVDPVHINVSPANLSVTNIQQSYITVAEDRKLDLLMRVIEREKPRQCIIFTQRKRTADDLYRELKTRVKRSAAMHGDLPQGQRERIMAGFRDGRVVYLVATDVVGRGIDVTGISHIINYDLPEDPENYIHRIGRTGRMGKDGRAIAFVTREQGFQLTDIEATMNKLVPEETIDGFEAVPPKPVATPEAPKPHVPVFGRQRRRYKTGL